MALRPFNVIELCAGAGGLGLGIELAVPGARAVAMVEREAFAAATLVGRMEAGDMAPAPVWSDLATFDGRPWRGRVHCVASGDPCQGNSVAGKQLGADDPRFLIGPVLRIVDQVRPLRFFRENVRGNVAGQLEALVGPLERMGYRVECGIFSSGETGASHRRDRFFLMADLQGEPRRLHTRSGRSDEGPADPGGFGGAVDDAERAQRWPIGNARDPERPHAGARGWHESATWAGAPGETVGHAPSIGRGEGRPEPELWSGRDAAAGDGGALADANSAESQGQQSGQRDAQGWQEQDGHPLLRGGAGLPVAAPGPSDPRWPDIIERAPDFIPSLSRYDRFAIALRDEGFAPDGSSLASKWRDLVQASPEEFLALRAAVFQAAAEQHLRRVAHAMADRVDRLRLLGNGVDPVAAAYAWLCLDARHRAHRAAAAGAVAVRAAA